jgi:hypothetical protein
MDDDTCPHCQHLWGNHDGMLTGSQACDVCGCLWQPPTPPTEPPTERDLLVDRVARVLYDGIRESCDGYVEDFSQYPNYDGIPRSETVDGYVDFQLLAKHVIEQLRLT